MVHYFGSHISGADLINAAIKIKQSGGNFMQIFLTPPGETKAGKQKEEDLITFRKFMDDNGMKVVVHSSYMHNIAQNWDSYSWWITNMQLEIKYAHRIGAIGLVIHFGKQLALSIEECYNNMYTSLIHIHNKTQEYSDVKLLLETSTGQGTETCYKLEDLAYFYRKFSKNVNKDVKNRVKLCVDTCHIFSAGYNLKTKENVRMYLEAFEELIGIRYIYLIHLNDCKVDVGCQKDRHAELGQGFIGMTGLTVLFKYFRKLGIPIILETPNDGYEKEIRMMLHV